MATSSINLPEGFVLDEQTGNQQINLPEGFVLDQPQQLSQPQSKFNKPAYDLAFPTLSAVGETFPKAGQFIESHLPNFLRGTLETAGGMAANVPGYVAGKRAADIADVGIFGKSYEELPGSFFADRQLKTLGERIDKFVPGNVVSTLLQKQPERGTIGGEFNRTARDLAEGFELLGVGEAAKAGVGLGATLGKKVGGFIKSHIPWKSKSAIEKMAAKELEPMVKNIQETPEYNKIYEESRALEKNIPNTKYTLGQASGEPNTIMRERKFTHGEPGTDVSLFDLQKLQSQRAGQELVNKNIPPQAEGIDDVLLAARSKKGLLNKRAKNAMGLHEEKLAGVMPKEDQATLSYEKGKSIFSRGQELKGEAYKKASERFTKLPDVKIETSDLFDDMKNLKDSFISSGYERDKFPESSYRALFNRIADFDDAGNLIGSKPVNYKELHGLASDLAEDLRSIQSQAGGNKKLGFFIGKLDDDVNKAIAQVKDINPEAYKAFTEAKDLYKKEYIEPFRQRTAGNVFLRGDRGAESKLDYSATPTKFTKNLDTAKDYTRVFGKGDKDIKDVMMAEMLNTSLDKNTHNINQIKASTWFRQNKGILDELGIAPDFSDLIKSKQSLDKASANLANYNKSILARFLNADPQHAIDVAMSGQTKNSAHAMRSLIQSLPSEEPIKTSAKKGLQKAFVDYLYDKSQKELSSSMMEEFGRSPIVNIQRRGTLLKQYDGALNELFKDEPNKLRALKMYQQNYEILQRNFRSPIGGGSDTRELGASDLKKLTGIALQGFGPYVKTLRYISSRYAMQVEQKVNAIILRGLLDPDVAFTLVNKWKDPMVFASRIDNHLMEMGAFGLGGRFSQVEQKASNE